MKKYIEFDGYCPESKLKGEKVQMLLNNMDFWESQKTGLQISTFTPYAAILGWRGKGEFREPKLHAARNNKGLILTPTKTQSGCEILPDEHNIFQNVKDLKEYISYINAL